MITIRLPWPPKELSPNARVHWAKKAKKANEYRWFCSIKARAGWWTKLNKNASPPISLAITFHPPDRRRRDLDNMLASIKAGIDGIADALGVDDQHFSLRLERGEPTRGGEVVAVITEGAEQ